jgi:transposase
LRQRFCGQQIAVCLEQSRGPLIYFLLQYDFFSLYPINPATLAKYRQAFSTAGGKDDPSDADYLLDLLEHHRDRLRPWRPDDEKTRTLRFLVEDRRRLVADRTRFSNRLTALLKGYFPQVLDWFEDIRTIVVCDFLDSLAPALSRAASQTIHHQPVPALSSLHQQLNQSAPPARD